MTVEKIRRLENSGALLGITAQIGLPFAVSSTLRCRHPQVQIRVPW